MSTLTQGREAYAERRWPDAVGRYTESDQAEGLPACDLEQLATSLILTGGVIETCHLAFDLRRAHEWTRALDKWCDAQPNLLAFSGQCQMHRAELYRLHGAWSEAIAAAKTAQDFAFRGDRMATYGGFYEQGEVQRLRGEFDAAEASYRHAQETGFPPQPGLALLRLAQGRPEQAQTLLRQTMAGIDPGYRRRMLAARVEIELAAGDADAARTAMEELATVCAMIDMPMLHALAEQAQATVLAHDGDPAAALVLLRRARSRWLSPAARPHAAHAADTPVAGALTARETEVAQLVSAGLTNRDIAVELFISEKTVARHLSNIFTKLGLTSRAAATAYAYQHGLV